MSGLMFLIPIALFLGLTALLAFLWALRSGQFEDLDTPALDILDDDTPRTPPPAAAPAPAPAAQDEDAG